MAVSFNVNNDQNINHIKGLTSSANNFEKEAIRVLELYKDKLAVNPGEYTFVFNYALQGEELMTDQATDLGLIKNYAGDIMIIAYLPKDDTNKEVNVKGYGAVSSKEDNAIFSNVEVLPSFPGGIKAFGEFLAANLKYPEEARKNHIQGRVFAQFVVEKDGSLSDIRIVRGIGWGCDEEAKRVLSLSPKWIPGMQNGKTVRVSYTIPIVFSLGSKVEKSIGISIKNKNGEPFNIIQEDGSTIKNAGSFGLNYKNGSADNLPLIRLNGVSISNVEINEIDPEVIESINVLKGESAIKKYGNKAKNGAIEIITKNK